MRAHLITSPYPLLLIWLPVSYPLSSPDAHTHRYRAKFITGSASILASKQEGGHSWLTGLRAVSFADAVQELCTLPGGFQLGSAPLPCCCAQRGVDSLPCDPPPLPAAESHVSLSSVPTQALAPRWQPALPCSVWISTMPYPLVRRHTL